MIEAITDTVISYFIALATQMLVFPVFDVHLTFAQHMQMVGVFTGLSLLRRYIVRRFFNHLSTKGA